MVEGGVAIVKYLLFLSNLVLWTGGLGLIILGSVLQLKFAGVLDILGDERLATPVILLAFGSLCTLLGFLGCCGAIRENYCLTVSFAVLLALVIMIETAAVITAYALHEDLRSGLSTQLQMGLSRYNRSTGVQMAWDQTQQTLSCCGVANSSDWSALGAIPDSCCIESVTGCAKDLAPLHPGGCMDKVEKAFLFAMVNRGRAKRHNVFRRPEYVREQAARESPNNSPVANDEDEAVELSQKALVPLSLSTRKRGTSVTFAGSNLSTKGVTHLNSTWNFINGLTFRRDRLPQRPSPPPQEQNSSTPDWILINAALVGGASAVLAGLQVIGVCFACCLSKSILKDFHDFYY